MKLWWNVMEASPAPAPPPPPIKLGEPALAVAAPLAKSSAMPWAVRFAEALPLPLPPERAEYGERTASAASTVVAGTGTACSGAIAVRWCTGEGGMEERFMPAGRVPIEDAVPGRGSRPGAELNSIGGADGMLRLLGRCT